MMMKASARPRIRDLVFILGIVSLQCASIVLIQMLQPWGDDTLHQHLARFPESSAESDMKQALSAVVLLKPPANTTAEHMDPSTCLGDEYCIEQASQWIRLRNVAFHNGELIVFRLNEKQLEGMFEYQALIAGKIAERHLPIVYRSEEFNTSECDEVIDLPVFLQFPWVTNNAFHAHNDNLLPLFFMANAWTPARDLQQSVLFYWLPYRGSLPEYRRILSRLIAHGRIVDDLDGDRMVCILEFAVGRGQKPFYRSHFEKENLSPSPYWIDLLDKWRIHIRSLFHVPLEPLRSAGKRRLVYIQRVDSVCGIQSYLKGSHNNHLQAMTDDQERYRTMNPNALSQFVQVLEGKGFEVDVLSSFHNVKTMLRRMNCDVLVGMHGAGLIHAMYAPPGALLVELRSRYAFEVRLMENMALDASLRYVSVDFRPYVDEKGKDPFSSELQDRLAGLIVDAMKNQLPDGLGTHENKIIL